MGRCRGEIGFSDEGREETTNSREVREEIGGDGREDRGQGSEEFREG